jgi:transglutaminase-like putative cysteine protease
MTNRTPDTAGRWAIRHLTTYRYSTPVRFATHVLRLTPRPDSVRCLAQHLQVTPTPLGLSDYTDAFGNGCTRVSFGTGHFDELRIDRRLEVAAYVPPSNPGLSLPALPWLPTASDALVAFRARDGSPAVAAIAQRLAAEVGHAPLAFFERLCRQLYLDTDRQIRVEGAAQTPEQTLRSRRGACRDLTVLFLAVCRELGVACRFVSGYQGQEQSPDGKRHLHAWPEVFVPEIGWLGYDPTHGVPAGPGHVALCVAPDQASTMPVEGGFYFDGPSVTSTLEYAIDFDPVDAGTP